MKVDPAGYTAGWQPLVHSIYLMLPLMLMWLLLLQLLLLLCQGSPRLPTVIPGNPRFSVSVILQVYAPLKGAKRFEQ